MRDDDCAGAAQVSGGVDGCQACVSAGGAVEVDLFVGVGWVCESGEDEVADSAVWG